MTTMRFSEALRLGSTLLTRSTQPCGPWQKNGCALQMAALAIGRNDLAYQTEWWDQPHYDGIAAAFGVPRSLVDDVWRLNDTLDLPFQSPRYSIDEIAAYVEQFEQTPAKETEEVTA